MTVLKRLWNQVGDWLRWLVIAIAFLGAPAMVFLVAWPLLPDVGNDGARRLMTWAILATMAFGAVAGAMVVRDLRSEP